MLVSVPKVSIDGESHGDLLLIAIGSGATVAVMILFVLTMLIRHKKKPKDDEEKSKDRKVGDFTMTPSHSDSGISTSSSQKSNLMFKYFGKSLSSFDLEKSTTLEPKVDSCDVAIKVDDRDQFYRLNILTAGSQKAAIDDSPTCKYIQTIEC